MTYYVAKAPQPTAVEDEPTARFRWSVLSRYFVSDLLLPIGFVVVVFGIWQVVVRMFAIPSYILPAPSAFLSVVVDRFGIIAMMAGQTAQSTLIGFAFGVTIGLVVGGLMGSSRFLYDMIYPSLIGVHAVPTAALIPLFVIWVGIGPQIEILTGTISSFFPVTVMVAAAIATSSPELDDVLRSLGARKIDVLLKVAIPQALPQFFSSIKLAISGAFIGTIVAEIMASSVGIGHVMVIATNNMDGPLAYAGLVVLAVMGVALYLIAVLIEKRMTGWAYRRN